MMKIFAFLLLVNTLSFARSPQDLLRKTAEHYQNLDSYEISAMLNTNIDVPADPATETPATQWIYQSKALTAAASAKYVPKGSPWPALPEMNIIGGDGHFINAHPEIKTNLNKQIGMSIPIPVQYDQLNLDVASVTQIGSENLKLGDEPVPCEILDVTYQGFTGHAKRVPYTKTVRYWISPEKLLLLQKKFKSPYDASEWTYTVTSVKLNQPPPQWLIDGTNSSTGKVRAEWMGKEAPDFTLIDLANHKVALSSLRGKVVLLDFWATYCGPCKEEMPMIEGLRDEYKDKGLEVYGVTDDAPEIARKWMAQYHRTLLTLLDPQRSAFEGYEVDSIPIAILIDRNGKVANYWIGMQPETNLRTALDKALGN